MIDIGMGSVQISECDQMGHLNVRYYVARADEALANLAHALGMGPRALRAQGLRLGVLDHHIRFIGELHVGAPFRFRGGVLGRDADTLVVLQEMRNTATDALAATFRVEVGLFDVASGERRPLPALPGADALHMELPAHAAPKGLNLTTPRARPHWDEAERLGLEQGHVGAVSARECDRDGWLTTDGIIARVWDGASNLPWRRPPPGPQTVKIGGAALEYRLHYHATPRAGDLITVRSGLREIGTKTTVATNWLFDRESGLACATAELVGVRFDLSTRKALEIDDETRARMMPYVKAGLAV
ncbi:MAG TPA: thioesterase family protein [Quisquiliibacterium sp.]|nr:thioesterase family protein [Quisquiliibacterium sp.]